MSSAKVVDPPITAQDETGQKTSTNSNMLDLIPDVNKDSNTCVIGKLKPDRNDYRHPMEKLSAFAMNPCSCVSADKNTLQTQASKSSVMAGENVLTYMPEASRDLPLTKDRFGLHRQDDCPSKPSLSSDLNLATTAGSAVIDFLALKEDLTTTNFCLKAPLARPAQ